MTIQIASASHDRSALKGQTLTFATDASTKLAVEGGGSISTGHKDIVKVRAAKTIAAASLDSTLQAAEVAAGDRPGRSLSTRK